jgi:hypothetical protein
MPTYKQIRYHLVFATQDRRPVLADSQRPDLFKYMSGVIIRPLRGRCLLTSPRSVGFTYGYRCCCPSGNWPHNYNRFRLTLMGLTPWAVLFRPFGPQKIVAREQKFRR